MNQDQRHRILLIQPPFYRLFKRTYSLPRHPLSLAYLSGAIRKGTDWDVMAYNADFYPQSETIEVSYLASTGFDNYLNSLKDLSQQIWGEVKSAVLEYKPIVVGITATSQNFASACIVAKLSKETDRQITVIVGGPHPSMIGADILNCQDIDISVKGEGENTIIELLNAIRTGSKLDNIQGISYKRDSQIAENGPRALIEDLDSLSFPHENASEVLKDYDKYPLGAFGYIFAIRGCPYYCSFCGSHKIWGRKVRFRSPQNVIKEINGLQKIGLNFVNFEDDTFGINKRYINDLCNALITNCPGLKWGCELNVKLVDKETISIMKAAGCFSIALGIESGNNEILKAMRKGFTVKEAIIASRIIKRHNIHLSAFFIVGYPLETERTLKDTIQVMKKIKCDKLIYSIFTPYPGTEAFKLCKEKGLIGNNYDVSLYSHQSPANCFMSSITKERFRALASKIEKMIDRRNLLNKRIKRIKRFFSLKIFNRIRRLRTILFNYDIFELRP